MKFTPAEIIAALDASSGIRSAAARRLNCARNTIATYVRRFPEVREALASIQQELLDLAENRLIQAIMNDNLQAIIFYLVSHGQSRGYGNGRSTHMQIMTPPVRSPSNFDWERLARDEQRTLLQLMRKAEVSPRATLDARGHDPVGLTTS